MNVVVEMNFRYTKMLDVGYTMEATVLRNSHLEEWLGGYAKFKNIVSIYSGDTTEVTGQVFYVLECQDNRLSLESKIYILYSD